jgi:hypothetical protein
MAGMRQPSTIALFALLICISSISIYQRRVIDGLRQAQVTPSFFLSDGAKAGVQGMPVPHNSRFTLKFQLLNNGGFSAYQGQILTQSGKVRSSFPIPAEQTRETIPLLLDSSVLGPDTYLMVIYGLTPDGRKTEITHYTFQLQWKE